MHSKQPLLWGSIMLLLSLSVSCSTEQNTAAKPTPTKATDAPSQGSPPLFTRLSPDQTGIDFDNAFVVNDTFNVFAYVNAFNGGGVAIGDLNNDNYADIYFTSNQGPNKLYISQGIMKFLDITDQAGVNGGLGWCSGTTMADVNGDGFLDIYVCKEFHYANEAVRENLLYINNGDLTFTNKAKEYGVADAGLSVQSTFFDYDRDGDLDLYVGNHPWTYTLAYEYNLEQQRNPQHKDSDHLYRNNGDGTFTDVSKQAGILNFGFTLGLVSSDFNKDGWPDIYVANDHGGPDRLFMNNGDGTFTNALDQAVKHTCNFAMGVDAGDVNNDGWIDLFNVDMLAEDNFRQKTNMSGMNPEAFWRSVESGYHYQYMRNALQINNGYVPGQQFDVTFSEVAQMAGVDQTDWSWAALMADFDNDGNKDLYVANGYRLDARDNDFVKSMRKEEKRRLAAGEEPLRPEEWGHDLVQKVNETRLPNYYFENNGDYTFTNKAAQYGLDAPGFSNGAAYADLDNDGDLDLVVNNMNEPAGIYQNSASQNGNNVLRVRLIGNAPNSFGIGAKVTMHVGDETLYQEMTLTRGFESSVEPLLHFGLGKHNSIDAITVEWPSGKTQTVTNQPVNGLAKFVESNATDNAVAPIAANQLFEAANNLEFKHVENDYNDYDTEVLLPHKMSQFGPALATGDVNADGYDDVYLGGAAGQPGALFLGSSSGAFKATGGPWTGDRDQEDMGAAFFDADGDGDLDLYVASGGNEFTPGSESYQDRLYLNHAGKWSNPETAVLPNITGSGSCVVPGDVDGDGDLDLFVGGRVSPGHYPFPATSYLLRNDMNTNGTFSNATSDLAPELAEAGLVTTAVWMDFNNDAKLDLIVAGEWMPIMFMENSGSGLKNATEKMGFTNQTGWWNELHAADFDGDGDIDIMAGNLGLNYKYQASYEEPFPVYAKDFDNNGSSDIVLGYYNDGQCFPVRGRQCSSEQIPSIADKFPTYKAFASADIKTVYGQELEDALHLQVTTFASAYIENEGGGRFEMHQLPQVAQFAPINGIVSHDFNGDGHLDALVAGNLHVSEVETGRADAGTGLLLLGDGTGKFTPVRSHWSGFFADGDVKHLALINAGGKPTIVVANNDGPAQLFGLRDKPAN